MLGHVQSHPRPQVRCACYARCLCTLLFQLKHSTHGGQEAAPLLLLTPSSGSNGAQQVVGIQSTLFNTSISGQMNQEHPVCKSWGLPASASQTGVCVPEPAWTTSIFHCSHRAAGQRQARLGLPGRVSCLAVRLTQVPSVTCARDEHLGKNSPPGLLPSLWVVRNMQLAVLNTNGALIGVLKPKRWGQDVFFTALPQQACLDSDGIAKPPTPRFPGEWVLPQHMFHVGKRKRGVSKSQGDLIFKLSYSLRRETQKYPRAKESSQDLGGALERDF